MRLSKKILSSFLTTTAYAHGRVTRITTTTGDTYNGWDPASSDDLIPPQPLAAWSASNLGKIVASSYGSTHLTLSRQHIHPTLSIQHLKYFLPLQCRTRRSPNSHHSRRGTKTTMERMANFARRACYDIFSTMRGQLCGRKERGPAVGED